MNFRKLFLTKAVCLGLSGGLGAAQEVTVAAAARSAVVMQDGHSPIPK
jgi:hypothetical protein